MVRGESVNFATAARRALLRAFGICWCKSLSSPQELLFPKFYLMKFGDP